MKRKKRKVDFLDGALVGIAAGILLFFAIGMFLLPQEHFSEHENRALSVWETPSWGSIFDGSFSESLGKLYRDQLPLRKKLISLKAGSEILLGKRENNGILWGDEGMLFSRNEYSDLSVAEQNLAAVDRFSAETFDLRVTSVWIPRSSDVMTRWLPKPYPSDATDALYALLEGSGEIPLGELRESAEGGTQVYYRTDHHLTTEGAYLVYCLLGEKLGFSPLAREFFSAERVSESFLGSADSAVGGIASRSDTVTLFRYEGDENVRVIDRTTGEERRGFYDWSAMGKKDQYSVFLGGNFAHLSVESANEAKPRLLLIKDSFANALVPFLALHFDLEIVDLRYLSEPLSLDGCDRALILQGVDTLATDPSLKKLGFLQKKG